MNNKLKVLTVFGFQLAGVNYLIADYLLPSLVCMGISFGISMEMNKKGNRNQFLTSLFFSLTLNLAIFFFGKGMMSESLEDLVFKLAILQAFTESGLLMRLCSSMDDSRSLLKIAGSFFLIACFLILLIPSEILNHFLYAGMKGNGAMALFVLIGEIFIPIILCSLVGMLCSEIAMKKEPNHFIGSIK